MNKKKIYVNCYSGTPLNRRIILSTTEHNAMYVGFKGMGPNMRCRGYQYEFGENRLEEEDNGPTLYANDVPYIKAPSDFISLCNRGLHFCWDLSDVFNYYPRYEETSTERQNRFFIVMTNGNVESNMEKGCTDKLLVLKEIPYDMIVEHRRQEVYGIVNNDSIRTRADVDEFAMRESGIHELLKQTINEFINSDSFDCEYETVWNGESL